MHVFYHISLNTSLMYYYFQTMPGCGYAKRGREQNQGGFNITTLLHVHAHCSSCSNKVWYVSDCDKLTWTSSTVWSIAHTCMSNKEWVLLHLEALLEQLSLATPTQLLHMHVELFEGGSFSRIGVEQFKGRENSRKYGTFTIWPH